MNVIDMPSGQSESEPRLDKTYYTISEVSRIVGVPSHVLRFWETQFSQLKPMKSRGRRYYAAKDILLLRKLRTMLHQQGYTIKGAQRRLAQEAAAMGAEGGADSNVVRIPGRRELLKALYKDLLAIRSLLDTPDPVEHKRAA